MCIKCLYLLCASRKATAESRHSIWRFYFKSDWIEIAQMINQAEVLQLKNANCISLC